MRASRDLVEAALARGDDIYGVSTGVGMRKVFAIEDDQAIFNRKLVRGHLIGQGSDAPADVVRAALLKLANSVAQGVTGARPELAEHLVGALNAQTTPRVRTLGSVGQGDLAAMADLAEGVLGEFELAAGEALVLMDNNAFSTGAAAVAVADCEGLLAALDVACALDLEAFAANLSVIDPTVGEVRPYPGLTQTIARLRELLAGSSLWDAEPRNLQDPLTFRTAAHVLGAARDALAYATGVLSVELNAHQGNPVVAAAEGQILPVGNFDVVPLAAALDFVRIALAPALTSAAERALKLLQAPLTGLTEGLAARPALAEPGLSELGHAVQGIVAEARLLAQPVSFEVASTTQHEGIEDRTTMAPLGARRLAEMVDLGARVVAIELTIAAQAVDLRRQPRLGAGSGRAHELVRERVPFTDVGDTLPPDLEPVVELVRSGTLGSADREERGLRDTHVVESLLERLDRGVVLGAEGYLFELERRGYLKSGPYVPEVVLDFPDAVRELHREFLRAGAEVMVAFTYYGHREKMRMIGREDDLEPLNRDALRIARQVADEGGALVAGKHLNTWVYTRRHRRFRGSRTRHVRGAGRLGRGGGRRSRHRGDERLPRRGAHRDRGGEGCGPAVGGDLASTADTTIDGVEFDDACRQLEQAGADVVGLNCSRGPRRPLLPILERIQSAVDCHVAAQPVPSIGRLRRSRRSFP